MFRLRIQQFNALTGLTALETLRQPVCLVLTLTSLAFIGVLPAILTHTLGESARLVRDSALALHFVCGLILGCYAACATLSREMRRGTAAAILAKPVDRDVFFLAKYAGIALVMLLFSLLMTIATMLSTRTVSEAYSLDLWSLGALLIPLAASMAIAGGINYLTHKPFVSVAFFTLVATLTASSEAAAARASTPSRRANRAVSNGRGSTSPPASRRSAGSKGPQREPTRVISSITQGVGD